MKTNRSMIALVSAAALAALAPLAVSAQPYHPGNDARYDNKHYRPGYDHRPGYAQPRGTYYAPPPRSYPVYEFRGRDRDYLYRHYQRSLPRVNVHNRPVFVPGHVMPSGYRGYIRPVPVNVVHHLPPVPRGYCVGYVQGYNVVYDPATFMIISAIDLLTR